MNITFYNFANADIKVDKTASLINGTVLSGEQIDGVQDLENPAVIIQYNTTPTFNYCYIPTFGRYYFINKITWLGGKAFEIQMHVDVLYTYKTEITGLSATAVYSNRGDTKNLDPRLSFDTNAEITVTEQNLVETPWYVVRYYADYLAGDSLAVPRTIRVAFMEQSVFNSFITKYKLLAAKDRVAVGNSIIDVTIAHYINYANITTELHAQKVLNFVTNSETWTGTPEIVTATITLDSGEDAYIVENVEDAYKIGQFNVNLTVGNTSGYFWDYDDEYTITLPYLGDYKFNLKHMTNSTVTAVRLAVSYEPFENCYVVIPYLSISGVFNKYVAFMQTYNVMTTMPFKVDTVYTNMGIERANTFLSVVGGVAGGMAAFNPMAFMAVPAALNSWTQTQLRDATGYALKGQTGGTPAYTSQIDGAKVIITQISQNPRAGYLDFWTDRGKPDGAFRALSSLSGFAQFDNIIMVGFDRATQTERNEIEAYLRSGVIL